MSGHWINAALGAWISSLLAGPGAPAGDVAVVFGPPGADGGPGSQLAQGDRPAVPARTAAQGINLHLMSIAPHAQATTRMERRTESQLVLRYLATSWAEHSDAADALLCTLGFHLLGRGATGPDGRSEITVEPAPALDVLTALGLRPRPALIFAIPLVHVDRPAPARRVAHPPVVRAELTQALAGTLVGPDGQPIAAAQVELPAFGRVTETDAAGQFRFAGVPADLARQLLRVRARGMERRFTLAAPSEDPLRLQMSFEEEG